MRLLFLISLLLLSVLACQTPASKPLCTAAQIWAAQVQEAGAKPTAAVPEKERAAYAQGFENGAAMVRKALDSGKKPFVLLPDEQALPPTPKRIGPLPEGVTVEPEALQIEMDDRTGLSIWAWGSVEGSTYARGQKDGFAWALSHHGQTLVKPKRRPILPRHWQLWPSAASSLKLEAGGREAEVFWAKEAILWRAAGQGFPDERRWRPTDETWTPRFVALQEDVLWVDTRGRGAVAVDLETGLIRDLRPSPNPPDLEAKIAAEATAERARIQEFQKETSPEASRKRWQEQAGTPEAKAHLEKVRAQAERGDAEAMFQLALDLANLGPAEDQESGKWLQRAAEQGLVEAMSFLGAWHYEGRCVEKSERLAREWLEKAAKAGDPEAKMMLVSLFGNK